MKLFVVKKAALAGALALIAGMAAAQGNAALVEGPAGQVTTAELDALVRELVPPAERADFWSNPASVRKLANSIYVQRALAQQARQQGLDKSADGSTYLKLVQERALSELALQQRVRSKLPDDKALDAYARGEYKAKPEQFSMPAQVHARHILLAVKPDGSDDAAVKARAEQMLADLKKGADFAKLATEHSADKSSAQRGGDLGVFSSGRMVPAFDKAVFALKRKGELSAPVRTQFGYHIIELIERREARTASFEESLPALREERLSRINSEERTQAWADMEKAGKVNDEAIDSLMKSRRR